MLTPLSVARRIAAASACNAWPEPSSATSQQSAGGATGLTAFDGLLMGSVAQQVLHTARGAVLVVRGSASFKE